MNFWDKIRDDERLGNARRKLSLRDLSIIRKHAADELEELLRLAYDDAAQAGLPARNRQLWEKIWISFSKPVHHQTTNNLTPRDGESE